MAHTTNDGRTLDFNPPGYSDPREIFRPADGFYQATAEVKFMNQKGTGNGQIIIVWTLKGGDPDNAKWFGAEVSDWFVLLPAHEKQHKSNAGKFALLCDGLGIPVPDVSTGTWDSFKPFKEAIEGETHTIRLTTRGNFQNVSYGSPT